MKNVDINSLREKLADLEHTQWIRWAGTLIQEGQVSLEKRTSWEKYLIPYSELSENMKELDRVLADKVLNVLREFEIIK